MIVFIQGKENEKKQKNVVNTNEFRFSWYKLAKKDGKMDKDRGEIEVSLQFFSKNTATGSVLDLTTKKKHVSLSDIKHSLRKKNIKNQQ